MNVIGYMVLGAVIVIALLFAIVLIWAGIGSKRKKSAEKSKVQFSKQMCAKSWRLMAITIMFCLGGEFVLQWTAKGSMREVVTVVMALISFVTVFINGGYITQNIFRDTSLNKNHLELNEETGEKRLLDVPGENPTDT